EDCVVYAASGVGSDGHLNPGKRYGQQGEHNRTQRVAAGQGGEEQGEAESVEHEGVARMPGECRNPGRCRLQGAVRQMGISGLPPFIVQPPEESTPVGGGGQKAAFAGQVAGVPGGVAAEGGQGLIDVVDDQRQGAQGEKEHGNDHPAERSHTNNLSGEKIESGPTQCHLSSMLPMLYPTLPYPGGSTPRRAGGDWGAGRIRTGATCRRGSGGVAGRPDPSQSRWSADRGNRRPADRNRAGRRAPRRPCGGAGRTTTRWRLRRAAWGGAPPIRRRQTTGIWGGKARISECPGNS